MTYNADEAARKRNIVLRAMVTNPDDKHHGTRYGRVCGCECARCKTAAATARAESQHAGIAVDDPRHGTEAGYVAGCLGVGCAEAARIARAKRRKARTATTYPVRKGTR